MFSIAFWYFGMLYGILEWWRWGEWGTSVIESTILKTYEAKKLLFWEKNLLPLGGTTRLKNESECFNCCST